MTSLLSILSSSFFTASSSGPSCVAFRVVFAVGEVCLFSEKAGCGCKGAVRGLNSLKDKVSPR